MKLYLLRHGIAEDPIPGRISDRQRKLTGDGIEQMRRVARGMRALNLNIDAIWTSPLVRAWQTAEIAAAGLGIEKELREKTDLACGCSFYTLHELLSAEDVPDRLLLVGHEPDLSENIGTLIGGGRVRMKKASLARVDVRDVCRGGGELRWLLEAEQLAEIR